MEGRCYIEGEWVTTDGSFDVTDPATGEVVGTAADAGPAEARAAVAAAAKAFPGWAALTAAERSAMLRRISAALLADAPRRERDVRARQRDEPQIGRRAPGGPRAGRDGRRGDRLSCRGIPWHCLGARIDAGDQRQLARQPLHRLLPILERVDPLPGREFVGEGFVRRDILEHGPCSLASHFFDVEWDAPGCDSRVVLPILGLLYAVRSLGTGRFYFAIAGLALNGLATFLSALVFFNLI